MEVSSTEMPSHLLRGERVADYPTLREHVQLLHFHCIYLILQLSFLQPGRLLANLCDRVASCTFFAQPPDRRRDDPANQRAVAQQSRPTSRAVARLGAYFSWLSLHVLKEFWILSLTRYLWSPVILGFRLTPFGHYAVHDAKRRGFFRRSPRLFQLNFGRRCFIIQHRASPPFVGPNALRTNHHPISTPLE